jgi:hypothetical protein
MITKPGIYTDIDPAAYLRDPCPAPSFTQSIAKVLLEQSPAHARLAHPRLAKPDNEPEAYSADRAIGDAAHSLLLGRGKRIAIGDFGNWQTNAAKLFKADALAHGATPILTHHMARAYAMIEAAREQLAELEMADLFSSSHGDSEVVAAWQEDGMWCRTMIDWLGAGRCTVADYKSTAMSCAPHAVEDRPSVLGWDMQAAMHERALDTLDSENAGRRSHLFLNQENDPPYALTLIRISEADLTMGRKKLGMAADIWRRCTISGEWPRYPAETVLSRPRSYLETRFLEREVAHDEAKRAAKRDEMLTDIMGG